MNISRNDEVQTAAAAADMSLRSSLFNAEDIVQTFKNLSISLVGIPLNNRKRTFRTDSVDIVKTCAGFQPFEKSLPAAEPDDSLGGICSYKRDALLNRILQHI